MPKRRVREAEERGRVVQDADDGKRRKRKKCWNVVDDSDFDNTDSIRATMELAAVDWRIDSPATGAIPTLPPSSDASSNSIHSYPMRYTHHSHSHSSAPPHS